MIPAQIRNRQPRSETCMQIALAIKDEVEDLEVGKIQVPKIVQVKYLRLFETFDRFNALGRVEDKGDFQKNKE
jgi:methionine synthase II (cobalamin-independent)